MIGLALLACRCGAPDPEPIAHGHFVGWERLVDAALRGDAEAVADIARDLTEGDAGATEEVGGALGFLQVADAAEIPDGVAAAAIACGACHRVEGVSLGAASAWTHADGARWLVRAAVRGEPSGPPVDDPLAQAWSRGDTPEASLAAALGACGACHGPATVR